MALTQYTADTDIIETLGTNPEDRPTLTDNTFKAKFDENSANIKTFLNAMIAELASTANGKGASQIGIEDSAGRYTATQIEAALAEIAGSGRTTETVKGLADLISTVSGNLTTHTADLITDSDGAHGLKVESGTFTPYIAGATTAGTNTYSVQTGFYTRTGKLCAFDLTITLTAKDAAMAGNVLITGLPFVSKNDANRVSSLSIGRNYNTDWDATRQTMTAALSNNDTRILLYNNGDSVGYTIVQSSQILASTSLSISGVYTTV